MDPETYVWTWAPQQNVAFVRCEAFHLGPDGERQVAVANGTFIVFRGKSLGRRRRSR